MIALFCFCYWFVTIQCSVVISSGSVTAPFLVSASAIYIRIIVTSQLTPHAGQYYLCYNYYYY